jgi:hypothetical protein
MMIKSERMRWTGHVAFLGHNSHNKSEKLKGTYHLEDLGVGGRIILKRIFIVKLRFKTSCVVKVVTYYCMCSTPELNKMSPDYYLLVYDKDSNN